MGGDDKKTVNTTQQSQTNPYAPTMPLLDKIIGNLGSIGTGETGAQSDALGLLGGEVGSLPGAVNPSGEVGAVNSALGTSTAPQAGILRDAYGNLKTSLGGLADPNNLNPMNTPGLKDALGTLTSDITNNVKGVFAGSGRDPSGAGSFAQSLGRGLMQGEAPVIQQAYQSNVGNLENATGQLASGAGSTASGLTAAQLAEITGRGQGLGEAGMLPGLLTAPGTAALGYANTGYNLPYQNVGSLEGLLNPIAGLGGQTSGSGTQVTDQSKSLLSNILGGAAGLSGLNGAMGSGWLSGLGSSIGGGLSSLGTSLAPLLAFSDERLKEDIEPVGETHDGQTLYSYHYIGDDEPRIGLLAHEVEERDPGAVVEIAGYKAVNYPRALRHAAEIGMLDMAA